MVGRRPARRAAWAPTACRDIALGIGSVEGLSISGDAAELRAELLEAEEVASDVRAEWDSLAVARAKPFSSPSWMLPWWRHARPSRAALRIVAVRRGDELIGLLPLFAEPIGCGLIRY